MSFTPLVDTTLTKETTSAVVLALGNLFNGFYLR